MSVTVDRSQLPSLAPRAIALLATSIGWFAMCVACLAGWHGTGDCAIVVAALVAVAIPVVTCCLGNAFYSVLLAFVGGSAFWIPLAYLHGNDVGQLYDGDLGYFEFSHLIVVTSCFVPSALLLHRGSLLNTGDAIDRVMLATAIWFCGCFFETTRVVNSEVAHHVLLLGWTAPLLGPLVLTLSALGSLAALAALARSVRWLKLWRAVHRGGRWAIVSKSAWEGTVPSSSWFHLPGANLDSVVVLSATRDQGAYREGTLETALSLVPSNSARVVRTLWFRVAVSIAVLVVVAYRMFLVTQLRW
jgi:hypothetical protein